MSGTNDRRPSRVPVSTYRLQLHREFPFAAARGAVDYLARLGVTDCYLSPIFAARPGSTHGYDVTDHNELNPELGGRDEYEQLAEALSARGMGQVLDFVPNHMGIDAASNPWWRDVLENGQCSPFARFFDIDWMPIKPELEGRVLLPILGRQYGHALENGELTVVYDNGALEVHYGSHRLPLNPQHASIVLGIGIDDLQERLGPDHGDLGELLSITSALSNLPLHTSSTDEMINTRKREKEIQRQRLARLVESSAAIREHLHRALTAINGTPGQASSFDRLHQLLEEQPYRLAYWRTASHEINYRRFFDINDLAGLRQEDPAVFDATHRLLGELLAGGRVIGVRIDHPDGLFDPGGYFDHLQRLATDETGAMAPLYVVAEKILTGDEELPPEWPVAGTTGYNFLNDVNGLFVDPAAARRVNRVYARFTSRLMPFDWIVYESKRLIMDTALASELTVLGNATDRIGEVDRRSRDFTQMSLREALMEIVACFPVYRTYVSERGWSGRDRQTILEAIACARRHNPAVEPSVFDFLLEVLLPRRPEDEPYEFGGPTPDDRRHGYPPADEGDRARRLRTSMKLQQYTAPVQAKGFEDTAFYRHNVLISLNEVGGEPARFGRTPEAFHRANQLRRERWPFEMLSSSTHDTKLGEDVRARINVLSELADDWGRAVSRWRRINQGHRTIVDREPAPDRNDEYRFYQVLVGAWPADSPERPPKSLVDRLSQYMMKSIKESKLHTSWINENRAYDDATMKFVERTLTGPGVARFMPWFLPFQRRVAKIGVVNALAQLVLKLASPGVPDFYQGCERWSLSLVDPDNRRPVDFAANAQMLDAIEPILAETDAAQRGARVCDLFLKSADGGIKLLVTAAGLRLRRDYPASFLEADYIPLRSEVTAPGQVISFARAAKGDSPAIIAMVPRLVARLMGPESQPPLADSWKTSRVLVTEALKSRRFRDVITGREIPIVHANGESRIFVGEAFKYCPVALLVQI